MNKLHYLKISLLKKLRKSYSSTLWNDLLQPLIRELIFFFHLEKLLKTTQSVFLLEWTLLIDETILWTCYGAETFDLRE